MNIGITLTFGVYGIIGGLYSELQKDPAGQSSIAIALEVVGIFTFLGFALWSFFAAYSKIEDENRE